jgi:hypothetical protein
MAGRRDSAAAGSTCAAAGLSLDSKAESYLERTPATLDRRSFPPRVWSPPRSRLRLRQSRLRSARFPARRPGVRRSGRARHRLAGGPRPLSGSSCPGALSADDSVAGIVRRRIPTVLASAGPAVDHRVPLAGFDADADASPERHNDLARPPRMPVRARGRVRPPDRKIVRQVAIIHQPIRTHVPNE